MRESKESFINDHLSASAASSPEGIRTCLQKEGNEYNNAHFLLQVNLQSETVPSCPFLGQDDVNSACLKQW